MQVGDILVHNSSNVISVLEIIHIHDNHAIMVKNDEGLYFVCTLEYISMYYKAKNYYEVGNIFKFSVPTRDKSYLYNIIANFYDSHQGENYVVLKIINPYDSCMYEPFLKRENELKNKVCWQWVEKESNV